MSHQTLCFSPLTISCCPTYHSLRDHRTAEVATAFRLLTGLLFVSPTSSEPFCKPQCSWNKAQTFRSPKGTKRPSYLSNLWGVLASCSSVTWASSLPSVHFCLMMSFPTILQLASSCSVFRCQRKPGMHHIPWVSLKAWEPFHKGFFSFLYSIHQNLYQLAGWLAG